MGSGISCSNDTSPDDVHTSDASSRPQQQQSAASSKPASRFVSVMSRKDYSPSSDELSNGGDSDTPRSPIEVPSKRGSSLRRKRETTDASRSSVSADLSATGEGSTGQVPAPIVVFALDSDGEDDEDDKSVHNLTVGSDPGVGDTPYHPDSSDGTPVAARRISGGGSGSQETTPLGNTSTNAGRSLRLQLLVDAGAGPTRSPMTDSLMWSIPHAVSLDDSQTERSLMMQTPPPDHVRETSRSGPSGTPSSFNPTNLNVSAESSPARRMRAPSTDSGHNLAVPIAALDVGHQPSPTLQGLNGTLASPSRRISFLEKVEEAETHLRRMTPCGPALVPPGTVPGASFGRGSLTLDDMASFGGQQSAVFSESGDEHPPPPPALVIEGSGEQNDSRPESVSPALTLGSENELVQQRQPPSTLTSKPDLELHAVKDRRNRAGSDSNTPSSQPVLPLPSPMETSTNPASASDVGLSSSIVTVNVITTAPIE